MSTMTVKTLSTQALVRLQHLNLDLWLRVLASSAANNKFSMCLKTDGSVRIDTVPPQPDVASGPGSC